MDDVLTEALDAAAKAARNAKRAAVLTVLAVAVAVAVLAIDNGIKRAIITEGQKAKGILDRITFYAEGGSDVGAAEAGEGGSPAGAGLNGSHGVDDDPGTAAVLDTAGGPAKAARPRRAAGAKRGAPGDG